MDTTPILPVFFEHFALLFSGEQRILYRPSGTSVWLAPLAFQANSAHQPPAPLASSMDRRGYRGSAA